MVSSEPLFKFRAGWPPIRKYRKEETAGIKAESAAEARPESISLNLLQEETNPEPVSFLEEPLARPASSSSVTSSVSLMNPYPIALSTPIPNPPLSGPFPLSFPPSVIRTAIHQFTFSAPSPLPSRSSSANSFHSGVDQNLGFHLNNNNIISGLPQSMGHLPLQSFSSSWQSAPSSFSPPLMGGSRNSPVSSDFPPLYSLPPTFWEPVIRLPEPTPVPPTSAPPTPTLEQLARRDDGNGENFTDDVLRAIILKAQPHHTNDSISHLTRAQLVKHVDDLVAWWKTAHPQVTPQTSRQNSPSSPSQAQASQHVEPLQIRARAQHSPIPAVHASTAVSSPPAKSQEKVIGQCPCCCDAQQNAAFAPCGHLYACTTCAHRLYDSGRGKCPVCRVPIQTYLKIYPTS